MHGLLLNVAQYLGYATKPSADPTQAAFEVAGVENRKDGQS